MDENMKFYDEEKENNEIESEEGEDKEQEKKNQEISKKKAQSFSFVQAKDDSIDKKIWGLFNIRTSDSLDIGENEPLYRTPLTNIIEGKNEYSILLELPGLSKKNVQITVQEGILEIKGDPSIKLKEKKEKEKEKKEEKKDKHKEKKDKDKKKHKEIVGNYLRREYTRASYYRSFALPEDIRVEEIEAKFKNGVLNLIIPKKIEDESEKQIIEIK